MAKRLSDELNEHLQCQIHLGTLENPKNLPCQHTFCEKCIDDWIVQKNYILICPYCNKNHGEYLNGAKELTTNYQLMGIIDVMDRDSKKTKGTDQNVSEIRNGVQGTMQQIRNSQVFLQQNCEIAKMELSIFRVECIEIVNALCHRTTEEINNAFYEKSEKLNRQMSECIDFEKRCKDSENELYVDEIKPLTRRAKKPDIVVESPDVKFEVKRPFDMKLKSAVKLIFGTSPDPNFCKIEVARIENSLNSSIRITVILRDSKDENVTCAEENVVVKVVQPDKTSDIIRNNGGYLFVPTMFGEHTFHGYVYDIEFGNSPYKLKYFQKPVKFFFAAFLYGVHDLAEFENEIFVAEKGKNLIVVFCKDSRLFKRQFNFDSSDMKYKFNPYGIAISTEGVLYMTDVLNHEVFVSDRYGKLETRFGKTNLKKPTGIALKNDGDILVADNDSHCIYVFDKDGLPKAFYGKEGVGIREFKNPWFIAIQKNQSWVVADHDNHRFQIIPLNGNAIYVPVFVCDVKAFVRGVAVDDNDNIIVSVRTLNNLFHIMLFNPLGVFKARITKDDHLVFPKGMCFTKINGKPILLVSDNNFGVSKLDLYEH